MVSFESKYAQIWEDKDKTIHIVMKENFVINEADAKEHIELCLKLADNERKKVLFDISKIQNLTNASMKKLLDPRLSALTIASAVLVGLRSPLVSMAISFLLKLDREPYPIKTFIDEKKAIEWLKSVE